MKSETFFENCYKWVGFSKVNSYYSAKLLKKKKRFLLLANKFIEKMPNPGNGRELYQSFIRKKNTKSLKQSETITDQPKVFENSNSVNTESVITEHLKDSHKLCKTENIASNSSLCSDTKNIKHF